MGDASGGGRWEILFNKVYINPMQLERVNEQAVMTARYPILKPCDFGRKQIEFFLIIEMHRNQQWNNSKFMITQLNKDDNTIFFTNL